MPGAGRQPTYSSLRGTKTAHWRTGNGCGCSGGCFLALFMFNLTVGGWSVIRCVNIFLGQTIDFWWAVLIGLFAAEFTVPLAIIGILLQAAGVHIP